MIIGDDADRDNVKQDLVIFPPRRVVANHLDSFLGHLEHLITSSFLSMMKSEYILQPYPKFCNNIYIEINNSRIMMKKWYNADKWYECYTVIQYTPQPMKKILRNPKKRIGTQGPPLQYMVGCVITLIIILPKFDGT